MCIRDSFKTYDAYWKKLFEIHERLNLMCTNRKQLESEEPTDAQKLKDDLKSKPIEFTVSDAENPITKRGIARIELCLKTKHPK